MWTNKCGSTLAFSGETTLPRNLLLRSLPSQVLERLSPLLHEVSLTPRRVLQHAGVPIEHVYFVEEGLVSVLAKTDERIAVEVWLIGREGAIGSAAVLGIRASTLSHFVQVGGSALRIGIEDLNRAMSESPCLHAVLHGYLHATLMQSLQSAACSLRHSFLQRLARWLLTAQDRSELDELPITQDLLARSLGVYRPTVSVAFKGARTPWHLCPGAGPRQDFGSREPSANCLPMLPRHVPPAGSLGAIGDKTKTPHHPICSWRSFRN